MITGIFIILYSGFSQMLRILPNWDLTDEYLSPVREIMAYILSFEGLLPMVTMFKVIILIMGFELALWVLKIVVSGLNFARGSGKLDF